MRKLILTLSALVLSLGVFAQEKEIKAAYDAIESGNMAGAKSEVSKVASQISSNTISPDLKAKYYYTAGNIALQEGNVMEAGKLFKELNKYENGIMYSARNKDTKNTEYFESKADAEATAAAGNYARVKEENLSPQLGMLVLEKVKNAAQRSLQQANTAFEANRSIEAGDKFLEAAALIDVMGGEANAFKYNGAMSYHKAESYQKAFDVYKELIDEGYTGESTSWVATEKDSGQEVSFQSRTDAKNQETLGLVTDVKEVKTPSMERNLYQNTLAVLFAMKKYDPIVEKITNKYSEDAEIQSYAANIYHESGNEDKYLNKLIENTKTDPTNATNFYNIGVLYMNSNNDAKSIEAFEKAIQLDPNYKSAYTNLAFVKIKPDKEYVEVINNNLGSGADQKKLYKEYTQKRKDLFVEVIPLLKKAFELDSKDPGAARALRQAYQNAEMFDKEDEMRAIEKSLEK